MAKKTGAIKRLTEDEVFPLIAAGYTQRKIARHFGMELQAYQYWLRSDVSRITRARPHYEYAATTYADMALDELEDASDPLELAKARERASHFRWLSAKYDRARFGEKLDVQSDHSITVLVARSNGDIVDVTPKNISKDEYKQLGSEGGVVAAGVGVALGNPTSTASHSHTLDSSVPQEEPKPKKKSILHEVGAIIRAEMEKEKDTK